MEMTCAQCTLCPRACGADRRGKYGFCGAGNMPEVASVCLHRGEEPPLNPIVNVFFAHCNLQCIYCQNWQISGAERGKWQAESVESLADRICRLVAVQWPSATGFLLGLVTAAHYADHIPALLKAIRTRGLEPTVVYNSSGYESLATLRGLEGLVDIYLPDFKYMDTALAGAYSHAPDYPEVAQAAVCEMIRQVGTGLKTSDGYAYRGLIVRHLVLPGHVDNSLRVLDTLADISSRHSVLRPIHLSLMAQYYPPRPGLPAPLDRCVTPDEYAAVTAHAAELGLTEGWQQELDATANYRPDFTLTDNPFEP